MSSALGNIFGGVIQGVGDTLGGKPNTPPVIVEPLEEEQPKELITIFGMSPLTFGLISVGAIVSTIIIVKLVKKI